MVELLGFVLAIASWAAPEPIYSSGLGVVYGGQQLVEANASFHSYDLSPYPDRCGGAAISPAMLGRIYWVRTEHGGWAVGPCLAVDVVARADAYGSIFLRKEVIEVSRDSAEKLDFEYGGPVLVWWGLCPPPPDSLFPVPQAYAPPLRWEEEGSPGRSFYPYPPQQLPIDCNLR